MCYTAKEHRYLMKNTAHLDTLEGFDNRHRKVLKEAHVKQKGLCIWCEGETFLWWEVTTEEFIQLGKRNLATREHMTPKSQGGDNTINNITCACYKCNSIRGTVPENQFKWVASNPNRMKKLLKIRARKKQEREEARRADKKARHAAHVERMAAAKAKKEANKAANKAAHKANLAKKKVRAEEAEYNYMMKVGKQMQKSVENGDRIMRRYHQCQEQKKKNLMKAIKSSFGERVKRFFGMENSKMVNFKPVRSFCAFL